VKLTVPPVAPAGAVLLAAAVGAALLAAAVGAALLAAAVGAALAAVGAALAAVGAVDGGAAEGAVVAAGVLEHAPSTKANTAIKTGSFLRIPTLLRLAAANPSSGLWRRRSSSRASVLRSGEGTVSCGPVVAVVR
jgi:hypothetical protein